MVDEGREPVMEKRAAMPYALAPFDRSVDMKIWNRRFKAYWLWLEGDLTQDEIAELLGYDKWTINKDLKAIREYLQFVPQRMEDFIRESYMRMVFTRNEVQQEARSAPKPIDKARLYTIVAALDSKILERFTQRRGGKTEVNIEAPDMGKYLLAYIGETYGSDSVKHALDWVDKKVRHDEYLKRQPV